MQRIECKASCGLVLASLLAGCAQIGSAGPMEMPGGPVAISNGQPVGEDALTEELNAATADVSHSEPGSPESGPVSGPQVGDGVAPGGPGVDAGTAGNPEPAATSQVDGGAGAPPIDTPAPEPEPEPEPDVAGGSPSDEAERCPGQALQLSGSPPAFSVTGSNAGAAADHDACFVFDESRDHVYRFVAPRDGALELTLSGDFDVILYVDTACGGDALVCEDSPFGSHDESATLQVSAGTEYFVVVDAYQGTTGTYTLTLSY